MGVGGGVDCFCNYKVHPLELNAHSADYISNYDFNGSSTLWYRASDYPREYDGACLQMRLSYCSAAQFFLFLVQWTDCNLAGTLGLLRILIYKVN